MSSPFNAFGCGGFAAMAGGGAMESFAKGAASTGVATGAGTAIAGLDAPRGAGATGAAIPGVDGAVSDDVAKPGVGAFSAVEGSGVEEVFPDNGAAWAVFSWADVAFEPMAGDAGRSCGLTPAPSCKLSLGEAQGNEGAGFRTGGGADACAGGTSDAAFIAATTADVGSTGVVRSGTGGAIDAVALRKTSSGASRITVASLSPSSRTASREIPDGGAGAATGGA